MGDGDTQPNETARGNGARLESGPQEWAGTAVHPVLAGGELNVVAKGTSVFLYDADNPRAWISGRTLQVGVDGDDERLAGVNGSE